MAGEKKKVIRPRLQTPASGMGASVSSGRLPDELIADQVGRLGVFVAVGIGLWSFGLAMDAVIRPLTVTRVAPMVVPTAAIVIEVCAITASALLFLYLRYGGHTAHTKKDAGLWYMILNAGGIAMLNTWARHPTVESMGHLSWITIAILVSAMIMPSSPGRMLAAAMVAASMDPLGVWIAHLRGLPVPSVVNTFVLCMPNYACAVVATVPSVLLQNIGRRLREAQEMGSYKLVELLGRGGMGEVWRAEHRLLARSAAIKLIRPEVLGASGEAAARTLLRRFEREAQATAALSSPHTIRLFDFGITNEGTFYYVMELLAGRDLDSLVREFGPLPANRALHMIRQVCHSLADAHARGLVHRDIKPANVYACRMGLEYDFVKVLDFGLAKFYGKASMQDTMMTADHMTTGTPAFMAPEVILGNGTVDRRTDVYALGCVMYYLLTGQLVFEADTPMKMFMQHVNTPPTPPSERTELPITDEIDQLVLRCLEKDPARRPQDAAELFGLAHACRSCEPWDNDAAKTWWERHLRELTGPLTLVDAPLEAADRPVAVS